MPAIDHKRKFDSAGYLLIIIERMLLLESVPTINGTRTQIKSMPSYKVISGEWLIRISNTPSIAGSSMI